MLPGSPRDARWISKQYVNNGVVFLYCGSEVLIWTEIKWPFGVREGFVITYEGVFFPLWDLQLRFFS